VFQVLGLRPGVPQVNADHGPARVAPDPPAEAFDRGDGLALGEDGGQHEQLNDREQDAHGLTRERTTAGSYLVITTLRRFRRWLFAICFTPRAAIATLTNDWQPGYLPTAASYGHGIYQEIIAAAAPGSLEALTESVCREIKGMVE
jgi:hypothetical protein